MPPFLIVEEPQNPLHYLKKSSYQVYAEKMREINKNFESLFLGLTNMGQDQDQATIKAAREALCESYCHYENAVRKAAFNL